MDFSRSGVVERVGVAFRAHVQWNDKGKQHAHGPHRPDEEAAKEDLESMRAAASGMSREDGFAAMKREADELKAGKPPKEAGFIDRDGNVFRALVQYREEGGKRHIPGPWRPDEEAAKDDLRSMRAAASGMGREDGLAAMKVEADRLKAAVTGGPPLQAPLAMYLLGGVAQAPFSTYPPDQFPLTCLTCGPEAPADVPFLKRMFACFNL